MFSPCLNRIFGLILLLGCAATSAAPWIEPGDTRLRHHIHVLADAALIRVPVNTWPLMWSGVISEVKRAKSQVLTHNQRQAVAYIEQAFAQQTRSNLRAGFAYAEQANPIRGFGDSRRDDAYSYISAEGIGENWAGRIRVNNIDNPLDGEYTQVDGSYLSGLWGNWAFTVGAIDRWWGPAWESGLILSNSARPVPALSLQRNSSEPFHWYWLNWLGPWQFTTFIGQLESDRAIENAKLVGARFSFRPTRWLEVGASRTAQWGGKDRPQNFSSFIDLVLGKDNVGSSGVSKANEPGNQLGGFDFRASINSKIPIGIYGEFIGEDEAGFGPSRYIAVLGADAVIPLPNSSLRIIAESADTAVRRAVGSEGEFNVAYEHSTYTSGYRYRGRVIGASVDNDSRAHHLILDWLMDNQQNLRLRLSQFDLNTDGRGRVLGNGNSVSFGSSNDYAATLKYTYNARHWRASLAYEHYNDGLQLRGIDGGDDTVAASFEYTW